MTGKPNIIVVLADDMGFGDATCYDPDYCKVPTPNIDRLAKSGMTFTDAHTTSSLCTPSRYGLLTGRYGWRTSLQKGVLRPYDPPLIAADRLTVPALLGATGYHTACIGKWHLGWDWPQRQDEIVFDEPIAGGPTARGFGHYFGDDVPNYPPYAFIEDDRVQGQPTAYIDRDPELVLNHPGPGLLDWAFERVLPTLAERAAAYIAERAAEPKPFFLFFSLTTPHEPIAPSETFKGKSGISGVADLIMETDWALGEVVDALQEQGIADDTLLVFTTDNGHCPYTNLEPFERVGHRVSGPYRGYKADIWEGGHRVPFVASWPSVIAPSSRCERTISLSDLMATCAELVDARLPGNAGEDSVSILPLLRGQPQDVRTETVYHSGAGRFAVFRGPWKLALCDDGGGYWNPEEQPPPGSPPVQLYHLGDDPGERVNLIDKHPDIARSLVAYLERVVREGRSTPGSRQGNDVPVDIWKGTSLGDGEDDVRWDA
jgi:arylsulfatase A-like enzyme